MTRKLMVLGLAAALAIAFAVPAFGETTTVTPSVSQDLSVRALAKARLALLTARSAKSQSRVAVRTAQAATNTANEAKSAAKDGTEAKAIASATQAVLNSTKVQSAFASGKVSTESKSYVPLSGGPAVAVNVPASGLIEVWAQATFEGDGAVGLFEDGHLMPGQGPHCAPDPEDGGALIASYIGEEITLSTPGNGFISLICGNEGPPAPVLFQASPGHHTYELRYQFGACGCGPGEPEAIFSQRHLFVAPRS